MVHDYQCVTEEAVASSRLMKARQYVTAETLMMGFVSARRLQNSAGGHVIQAWTTTEIHDMSGKLCRSQHRLSSGGAVRRNSLRCAPFGPPTVSCVLAPARTCLRQAPPTSRGRGLATSAVPHHLADDMSMKRNGVRKRHYTNQEKRENGGVQAGLYTDRSDSRLRYADRARRGACGKHAPGAPEDGSIRMKWVADRKNGPAEAARFGK